MTTFYVATLARYVLVEADGPDEARKQGEDLLGFPARTVRVATADEIALQRWHNNKIREEAATTNGNDEPDKVSPDNGCPRCGERSIDNLEWDEDGTEVRCTSCDNTYVPGQPRTCECSTSLPNGAVGICGRPATWRATGGHLTRPIVVCDSCKRDIEERTKTWHEQMEFERLPGVGS